MWSVVIFLQIHYRCRKCQTTIWCPHRNNSKGGGRRQMREDAKKNKLLNMKAAVPMGARRPERGHMANVRFTQYNVTNMSCHVSSCGLGKRQN